MVIFYKKWKKYNEIQLTKNKIDLNIRNMTNHPPSTVLFVLVPAVCININNRNTIQIYIISGLLHESVILIYCKNINMIIWKKSYSRIIIRRFMHWHLVCIYFNSIILHYSLYYHWTILFIGLHHKMQYDTKDKLSFYIIYCLSE